MATDLSELRADIDAIDTELIELLARRFKLTQQVGEYKKEHALPAVDESREIVQFEKIRAKADSHGLDTDFAARFLRLVIDEVVKNHKRIKGEE